MAGAATDVPQHPVPLPVRVATALFGGYGAAAGLSSCVARLLPIDRAEATSWALLLSFLLYTGFALWMFGTRHPRAAIAIVWAAALASGALAWALGARP